MIALIQRVSEARVVIAGEIVGEIEAGILAFVGVEKNDTAKHAERLLERILGYRIFEDADARMNQCVREVAGGLLLVPQFTLAADTRKGMRPGFSRAADPQDGRYWFDYIVQLARRQHHPVASGRFGANMQVSLVNDGPATFWLQVSNSPNVKSQTHG